MFTLVSFRARLLIASVVILFTCAGASAADLKVGYKTEVTAADPHVLNGPNRNIWAHIYEALVGQDDRLQPKPQLATSWRPLDDTTWEFKLRAKVLFHDGSPFTAEDVKFSIERGKAHKNPRTFRSYIGEIDSVEVRDPLTVVIKTKQPHPLLPSNLSVFPIVSKKIGNEASEESFASGKAAIGTGPYRFVEWVHGERIVLARNEKYWDTSANEPWDKVTFQFIPKDPARVSSLLAGAVDVINAVSSNFTDSLERSDRVGPIASTDSYAMIPLFLDLWRDESPYVKDSDGKPMGKNPLKDRRVRQALSLAINRDAIVKRVMKGDGEPAGQLVTEGFLGHDPALKADGYDPAKAKALLKEAGYPNGFRLTIHCSNDRYLHDAKNCEALGQMFTQVGVKTEVQTLPFSVFLSRAYTGADGQPEFSAFILQAAAVMGDALPLLITTAHTYDKAAGRGQNNTGRYSNKQVDEAIGRALKIFDDNERRKAVQAATKAYIDDIGVIPLHFEKVQWAARKGITIKPRSDGFTYAMNIRQERGVRN